MKKPTATQRKVLEAMRDGCPLERRQSIRINKPRYWTLGGRKIAEASPMACLKENWIEAATVLDVSPIARWSTLYTLTDAGLAAISEAR
jgi:hypothetical protein